MDVEDLDHHVDEVLESQAVVLVGQSDQYIAVGVRHHAGDCVVDLGAAAEQTVGLEVGPDH